MIPHDNQLENISSVLYLQYNTLTGTIPWELGKLTKIEQLVLDHNLLTGAVPYLGDCSRLGFINLGVRLFPRHSR